MHGFKLNMAVNHAGRAYGRDELNEAWNATDSTRVVAYVSDPRARVATFLHTDSVPADTVDGEKPDFVLALPQVSFNEIADDAKSRWRPGETEVMLDGNGFGFGYVRVPLAPMQLSGESIAFNIWRDSEDVTEKRVELRERAEAALAERFDSGEAGPELDEAQRRYRERFMEDFEESPEYADAKTHYIEEHLEEWIAELRDELSVV